MTADQNERDERFQRAGFSRWIRKAAVLSKRRLLSFTASVHAAIFHTLCDILGDLLAGYLTGSRRRKGYATVDYDRLLSQAATEKRFAQQQSLHIRQLASKGRESRRQWQLRQHREAWHRERAKITRQISQCQHELRSWRAACLRDDVGGLRPLMEELFQLECDMAQERAEFAHQITSPVRDIRSETEALSRRAPGSPPISQESIGHFIQEVTEQLIHIGQILEEEVKIMSECEEVWSKEEPDEHRPLSVPVELQALPCPSAKLKSMMGDECIALDYFFQQQLQELKRPQKARFGYEHLFNGLHCLSLSFSPAAWKMSGVRRIG